MPRLRVPRQSAPSTSPRTFLLLVTHVRVRHARRHGRALKSCSVPCLRCSSVSGPSERGRPSFARAADGLGVLAVLGLRDGQPDAPAFHAGFVQRRRVRARVPGSPEGAVVVARSRGRFGIGSWPLPVQLLLALFVGDLGELLEPPPAAHPEAVAVPRRTPRPRRPSTGSPKRADAPGRRRDRQRRGGAGRARHGHRPCALARHRAVLVLLQHVAARQRSVQARPARLRRGDAGITHRWHHAEETAATPCNFAGVFPVWDLLFGTFYLPAQHPRTCGPGDTPVPSGLLRQLVFPFKAVFTSRASAPGR